MENVPDSATSGQGAQKAGGVASLFNNAYTLAEERASPLITCKMILQMLFHLVGALQFAYGCYYDHTYVRLPSSSGTAVAFGGKLKYLSFINAMIQTVYFTVALLNDLLGSDEPTPSHKPLIRCIKDSLFSTLAFPVAMFVGTTFWGIYAIVQELILPRSLDAILSVWLNHVMHTNIVVFIIIELLLSFRMYPTRKFGLTILSTFMLGYAVWIHVIYFNTGTWVYPVLAVLNWPMRIAFYLFALAYVSSLYVVGEKLNKTVWAQEVQDTVKSGKKKAQ